MEELILKEREFKENIVKVINESGLPAFIMKPTIKEILEQLNAIEEQDYNTALQNKEKNKEEGGKSKGK